jgi:uncharacterized protein
MSRWGRLFKALIRGYQVTLSPFFGAQCRFYPTCSCYAIEAIEKHGAIKGIFLAIYRIFRCNPFSKGGIDPVPEKQSKN